MNRLTIKLTIFCMSLFFINLVFVFQSNAKINLENCVGMWLFNEGNGGVVKDSVGKCKDGKINGAIWADGKFGKALSFNGSSDYVEVPDMPDLNPKKTMSMGCWVYVKGNAGQHRDIISKDGESAERQYLLTSSDVNKFRAHIWTSDGTAHYFDGKTSVELETWYHVAQTYDGKILKLYVNGKEDGNVSFSGDIIVTAQPVRIGGGANAGATPYHTPGIIDEVFIFNSALEQEDVQNIMNNGLSGMLAVSSKGKLTTTWSSIKTY
ncbi:MAG: LamG domain-containing protein [Candidatus Poribacteria bacterium]